MIFCAPMPLVCVKPFWLRLLRAAAWVVAVIVSSASARAAADRVNSNAASQDRIAEIAAALTEHPVGIGKPITDRPAWEALVKLERYRAFVHQAEEIAARPIPVQPDDLYMEFSRTGNRSNWEAIAFQRRREFGVLVLAECLEDRGRFLPKIREYVAALCAEPTWVWAAHDRKLANFKGETVEIDLGAAELGWVMAAARWLLAARLPAEERDEIAANVKRRVVDPFLAATNGTAQPIGWTTRPNNWNTVCHAGVVGAALATVEDRNTRAIVIEAAERNVQYFIDAFGRDGYCSEGLGYWNYGFGHYVLLAESVRQATRGHVDFMARPGVSAIASFGSRLQIMDGVWPAFGDCAVDAKPAPQIMRYANARFGLGMSGYDQPVVQSERMYLYEEAIHAFLDPSALSKAGGNDAPRQEDNRDSPLRTWFTAPGVLVARPAARSACRIGVALKGGTNAELHNHNDLGSFVVVLKGRPLLLDPGAEFYTARTFGPHRYESKLINSFGHSVPVVGSKLQTTGGGAVARIGKTDFNEASDRVVMDITSAYAVPQLKRLERTFAYDRRGAGSLTVTDRVEFSSPQEFESALITLGRMMSDGDSNDCFIVADGDSRLRIQVDANGATHRVSAEVVRENAAVIPTRISIRLAQPAKAAVITLTITPIE